MSTKLIFQESERMGLKKKVTKSHCVKPANQKFLFAVHCAIS